MSSPRINQRFDGFLPVVVDVETGGSNPKTDALLEIAAQLINYDNSGQLTPGELYSCHVTPFKSANLDPKALAITGIDPFHPFRFAVTEKAALQGLFDFVTAHLQHHHGRRAVLVGHNAHFDLSFIAAATTRCELTQSNPFHSFTVFDTATLGGLALGKTVLAKAVKAAEIPFDKAQAHSAIYDTKVTSALFCQIVNRFDQPEPASS